MRSPRSPAFRTASRPWPAASASTRRSPVRTRSTASRGPPQARSRRGRTAVAVTWRSRSRFIRRTGTLARRPLAGQTAGAGRSDRCAMVAVVPASFHRRLLLLTLAALVVRLAWVWLEPATEPVADENMWLTWGAGVLPSPEVGLLAAEAALHLPPAALPVLRRRHGGAARQLLAAALPAGRARRDAGAVRRPRRPPALRRDGRARGGGVGGVLPGARLVRLALLGRDRVHGPALVGDRAARGRRRGRVVAGRARRRRAVRARDPDARDGALLRAARGAVARVAARRRAAPRRAVRPRRGARGAAVDRAQLARVRRVRARLHRRRAEPLAGQRPREPAAGLRRVPRGARQDRAVRERAPQGDRGDPRAPALVAPREAARRAARVLGGPRPADRAPRARGLRRRAAAARPRRDRGGARALPRAAAALRRRGRVPPARPAVAAARRLPRLLRAAARRQPRLPPLPAALVAGALHRRRARARQLARAAAAARRPASTLRAPRWSRRSLALSVAPSLVTWATRPWPPPWFANAAEGGEAAAAEPAAPEGR